MKVSAHWFLDYQYSDEYENALKTLKQEQNLDLWIDKNLDNIFYEQEQQEWTKKLLVSSYIKYSIGKDDEAQEIYGLAKDETLKKELYKEILKRSIYEYLMAIKYDKNINHHNLTIEDIDNDIKYIEEKWVQHV